MTPIFQGSKRCNERNRTIFSFGLMNYISSQTFVNIHIYFFEPSNIAFHSITNKGKKQMMFIYDLFSKNL